METTCFTENDFLFLSYVSFPDKNVRSTVKNSSVKKGESDGPPVKTINSNGSSVKDNQKPSFKGTGKGMVKGTGKGSVKGPAKETVKIPLTKNSVKKRPQTARKFR